jgi:hypothetical protein
MKKPRLKNHTNRPKHYTNNFESHDHDHRRSGPRVNYQQMYDKYLALAREANGDGDRVSAEYNFQYADHYLRIIRERQRYFNERRQPQADGAIGEEQLEAAATETHIENDLTVSTPNAVAAIIGELGVTA